MDQKNDREFPGILIVLVSEWNEKKKKRLTATRYVFCLCKWVDLESDSH